MGNYFLDIQYIFHGGSGSSQSDTGSETYFLMTVLNINYTKWIRIQFAPEPDPKPDVLSRWWTKRETTTDSNQVYVTQDPIPGS